jgi:hypothetical protein
LLDSRPREILEGDPSLVVDYVQLDEMNPLTSTPDADEILRVERTVPVIGGNAVTVTRSRSICQSRSYLDGISLEVVENQQIFSTAAVVEDVGDHSVAGSYLFRNIPSLIQPGEHAIHFETYTRGQDRTRTPLLNAKKFRGWALNYFEQAGQLDHPELPYNIQYVTARWAKDSDYLTRFLKICNGNFDEESVANAIMTIWRGRDGCSEKFPNLCVAHFDPYPQKPELIFLCTKKPVEKPLVEVFEFLDQ